MYFESIADLIAMEGHGVFVWSSYAVFAIVIGLMIYLPIAQLARHKARLKARFEALSRSESELSDKR
jgi:heme exporter protein D